MGATPSLLTKRNSTSTNRNPARALPSFDLGHERVDGAYAQLFGIYLSTWLNHALASIPEIWYRLGQISTGRIAVASVTW